MRINLKPVPRRERKQPLRHGMETQLDWRDDSKAVQSERRAELIEKHERALRHAIRAKNGDEIARLAKRLNELKSDTCRAGTLKKRIRSKNLKPAKVLPLTVKPVPVSAFRRDMKW